MAGHQYVRELAGGGGSRFHRVDNGCVKAGAGARYLVREINGAVLTYEIFVPAHAAIRRGFPGFAAEAASMNHHDRRMLARAHRRLILHVHLVYRDIGRRRRGRRAWSSGGSSSGWIGTLRLAANEETSLLRQYQRFMGL